MPTRQPRIYHTFCYFEMISEWSFLVVVYFFSANCVSNIKKAHVPCLWDGRIYKLNFFLTVVFANPLLNNTYLFSPVRLTQMPDTMILSWTARIFIWDVPEGFLQGNRPGLSQALILTSCVTFQTLLLSSSLSLLLKCKLWFSLISSKNY